MQGAAGGIKCFEQVCLSLTGALDFACGVLCPRRYQPQPSPAHPPPAPHALLLRHPQGNGAAGDFAIPYNLWWATVGVACAVDWLAVQWLKSLLSLWFGLGPAQRPHAPRN